MEKQKNRILMVEDARYMCEMLKEMLNPEEYEIVDIAVNGIEAVRKYKELEPDIVTMDVVMEEMDGIQATKEIKKYDPDALIIVISALGTPEHKKEALEAGADYYLWKPFTVKNLSRVSEQRRAEEEVKKSRKFLDAIIEGIPDSIYIKDRQFRFVEVNEGFCRTHNVTKGEILGEPRYRETDDEVFKTGKELDIPEQHYTDAEGNQHWTDLKKVPLTDESGNVIHVLTISHEVTKRKRAEEILRESQERLEELSKMKTDFLNVAYHEMRSPLSPIVGYTSLLEQQGELNEKQKKYVRIIEESASQLEELIESLLEVTRIEAGTVELTLQTVLIPEIVDDVLERVKLQAEAKKQTISAVVPGGIEVEGDKQRITAIFDNLISNAIKYTGENGRIDVVVEDRKDEEEIRVCVADTGVGIPEEHLHRVFERFYMVDNSLTRKGGLGLGLAIVKGYVYLHGGKVGVTSEPGKGSKFWFTLPKRRN